PRSKIAEMVKALLDHGAKVIAFDSVFAEPEINPMLLFLEKSKEFPALPAAYRTLLDQEVAESNSDEKLAAAIETHADKLILGGFFEDFKSREPKYIFCNRIANKYHDNYIYLTSIESNTKIFSYDATVSSYINPIKEIIENA